MKKVVFITGVTSGFGKATAELLSQKDYTVYGTSRKAIVQGTPYTIVNMDVTDRESIRRAVDTVIQKEGRIDVLINNAGMGISGSLEDTLPDESRLQVNTNFWGTVDTCQAVLPYMRKQGKGLIVNTSSIGGLIGLPFQGFYSASKFAIEGYSEALRMEIKPFHIKVVVVNPGDFHTNFTANRKLIMQGGKESAYDASFQRTLAVIEHDETHGLPPQTLARKIAAIIEKKNPCGRYVVSSFVQKIAVFLERILPDTWFDAIIGWNYKV